MGLNKTYLQLKEWAKGIKNHQGCRKPNNADSELHKRIKVGNKTEAREWSN